MTELLFYGFILAGAYLLGVILFLFSILGHSYPYAKRSILARIGLPLLILQLGIWIYGAIYATGIVDFLYIAIAVGSFSILLGIGWQILLLKGKEIFKRPVKDNWFNHLFCTPGWKVHGLIGAFIAIIGFYLLLQGDALDDWGGLEYFPQMIAYLYGGFCYLILNFFLMFIAWKTHLFYLLIMSLFVLPPFIVMVVL